MTEDDSDYSSDDNDLVEMDTKIIICKLKSFYENYLKDNLINLQPLYQREFSWNESKQDFFIDSIYNGFISQNIILNKLFGDEKYKYECIDGHHRLTVIKKYIEGKLMHGHLIRWKKNKNNILYDNTDNKNGIKNIKLATSEEKKKFNSYKLIVTIINSKLPEKKKQKIFNRLQNGEHISVIEKIKNVDHPIIHKLYKDNAFKSVTYNKENTVWNKISERIQFDKQIRGNNYISMATFFVIKCVMILVKKSFNIESYSDDKLKKYLETVESGIEIKNIDNIYNNTKDILDEIFNSINFDNLCQYFVFILIYLSVKDEEQYKYIIKNYKIYEKYNSIKIYSKDGDPTGEKLAEIKDKIIN